MKNTFKKLAFEKPQDLIFGKSKTPLRYGLDLEVGNGKVIPEVKYFPKPEHLKTYEETVNTYKLITVDILKRAAELGIRDVQLELELPAQLTKNVKLGGEVTQTQKAIMEEFQDKRQGVCCKFELYSIYHGCI